MTLECFEAYSNCDPEGARIATNEFWDRAVSAAKCDTREQFNKLCAMVRHEGHEGGPAFHADLPEQFGVDCSFDEALQRVRAAIREAPEDVHYHDPEYDDSDCYCDDEDVGDEDAHAPGCPMHPDYCPEPNCYVDAAAVRQSAFGWYRAIYGGWP